MSARRSLFVLIALIALSGATALASADKGASRKVDLIWTHPDFATLAPRSIAFMPAVSYNADLPSEHAVEDAAAGAFRKTSYRWVSPGTVLALLPARASADSTWKAQRAVLLKQGRVDSLAAPILCGALRTRAVLTFRVDQLERHDLQWDETGRPSTAVQVHAALVDSTGRLLWSASGSEMSEGVLQETPSNMTRVDANNLTNAPATGTGKSPEPRDVLGKLFVRWVERFPAPPAPPATTP